MLLDPIEKFGAYEKNYTLEQKEEVFICFVFFEISLLKLDSTIYEI